DQNPLGKVITGPAGAGKTHFLGAIRQELVALPAWFVLVDMSDVKDFWETVLSGYVHSLQQVASGNRPQFSYLLEHLLISERQSLPLDPPLTEYQQKKPANLTQRLIKLFRQLSSRRGQEGPLTIQQLANYGEEKLSEIIKHTIHRLSKQFP